MRSSRSLSIVFLAGGATILVASSLPLIPLPFEQSVSVLGLACDALGGGRWTWLRGLSAAIYAFSAVGVLAGALLFNRGSRSGLHPR
jgi:hypothetical protein